MKLNRLNNGYIVVKSAARDEYEYARPSDVYTMGIYHDGTFVSSGMADVYVYGAVAKGQKIRSRISGDRGSPGMAVPVTSGFAKSYLRIGTAIEAGRNKLVKVMLDIGYVDVSSGTMAGNMDDIPNGATYVKTENNYTDAEVSKLAGIEAGAEVNNISDVNATDLTDGGETTLHTHPASGLTQQQMEGLI